MPRLIGDGGVKNTAQEIRDALLTDDTKFKGNNISNLDKAISTLNDLAQSDILSDGTPFKGANIDTTISSRMAPYNYIPYWPDRYATGGTSYITAFSFKLDFSNVNKLLWATKIDSGTTNHTTYIRLRDVTNAATLKEFSEQTYHADYASVIDVSANTGMTTLEVQVRGDSTNAYTFGTKQNYILPIA